MKHWVQLARDQLGVGRGAPQAINAHLEAAAQWICRAQAATPDDGVAHSYDIRANKWLASYPETTGYIIPTLYDYAQHFNKPQYREAARRMAQWEVDVQLPEGGVRAGTMDAHVITPTIFNTGQVLFGLARAAKETNDDRFLKALKRAADWLVKVQDEDGCWRQFQSPFTTTSVAAYNTRTAFGLSRAFEVIPDERYLLAADRNIAWALSTAGENDWFPGNCLTRNSDDSALTHTIAYSIRGLLEVGVVLEKSQYLEHALRMAKAVALAQREDGSLPGYLTPDWQGKTSWTCVTGNSQMAINWFRLARETGESLLVQHAIAANRHNMGLQDLSTDNVNIYGAIKGSHPINGGYMTWRFPNWAAKFFMDALMLEALGESVENIG
ncbi:hypothetical protein EBAPG3_001260 [Nitrosospira lacus]|uniref:Broad-specificity ulvan lyase N-terminal domain-containing protein n=1 Tax=Nitrosospira lacus TaxID=1288494 RepID=A0A1W6SL43_9PROT|nr:pectate lyase [Nitrosospira lacus]ARO86520.1 hypothetical protein EBAPG3_001260 [Nitrosospira lacus]